MGEVVLALVAGCVGTPGSGLPDDPGDTDQGTGPVGVTVSGNVRDLETEVPVMGSASILVDGVVPAPSVTVSGGAFLIEGIPANSVINLLVAAPPTHRSTYNPAVPIAESDLELDVSVVSETFVQLLALVFEQEDAGGIILARALDGSGVPYAGLPASAIEPPTGAIGPFFLDEQRQPNPTLTETTSSGWIVFFGVSPGVVGVRAAPGANFTLTMADSPVAATAVTLADILVMPGAAPPPPTNVSFSELVAPVFLTRGCTDCHDGGGIGMDLGDLHLNGEEQKMYNEVAVEISPRFLVTRVNRTEPERSLLLTMPSREGPTDAHPTVVFPSASDPDFQTILAWIREGALEN